MIHNSCLMYPSVVTMHQMTRHESTNYHDVGPTALMSKLVTESLGPADDAASVDLKSGYNQFWFCCPDVLLADGDDFWLSIESRSLLVMIGEDAGDPYGDGSLDDVTEDKDPDLNFWWSSGVRK